MAGIVHFSNFFVYMEQCEHRFLRSLGLSVHQKSSQGDPDHTIGWPRVSATCEYFRPIRFEDQIKIELAIIKLGQSSVTYQFDFSHEEEAIASGKMTAVCCRIERGAAPKAIAIPPAFLNQFRPYVCES